MVSSMRMSRCSLYDIAFGYGGSWSGEMLCTYHHHRHQPHHHPCPQQQQLHYLPRFYSRETTTAVSSDASSSISSNSNLLKSIHGKSSWLPLHITKLTSRETSSFESPSKELTRNGNTSSDCSCGGGSNHGSGLRDSNRVRKINDQDVRCSLPLTDKFSGAVSSEKENVFEGDLSRSCFDNSRNKMAVDPVHVMSVGQRKLFLSTGVLRLIPTDRPQLLPIAKRHRTLVAPQLTPKTQSGYVDPVINGGSEFQQRLAELAALQFETVRWEKQRKAKKK